MSLPASIHLARELALLGAEAAVALGDREIGDAHAGWPGRADAFAALGARMHAVDDELSARVASRLPGDRLSAWLLALCAAAELHPEAAAAYSILAEDPQVHLLTPAVFARLLRAALDVPYAEALAHALPGAAVDRFGFVDRADTGAGKPRAQQGLRLAAGELAWLVGNRTDPDRSVGVRLEPPASETAFDRELVAGVGRLLDDAGLLCIRAHAARQGRQLAIDLATLRGRAALLVTATDDLPDPVGLGRLEGGLVVVDLFAFAAHRSLPASFLAGLAEHVRPVIVVLPHSAASAEPAVDAPSLTLQVRRRIFAEVTSEAEADALAPRFRTGLEEARGAARSAANARRVGGQPTTERPSADELSREILAQGARRMDRLVTHLPATTTLDDLVVGPSLRDKLGDIVSFARVGPRVLDSWPARAAALGNGLSCLFAGPPGTGKTFAAQCLAKALGLNLYRIDLSQVVSKYIGETEKALSRVFDEAEAGHGLLLFDEADALFGKRSEVKDAHDRYANIEVGYLLQRMESFDGVSILTTNLRNNLDPAFLRRIRFFIEFPLPDASMRRQLWERSLPPRSSWERNVRLEQLVERFPLAGGDIHNAGLAAAHLAAASPDGRLRMEHLVVATFRELEKTGHSRSRDDFGPLATYLPGRSS